MAKYRKKPVVIEAVQYQWGEDGTNDQDAMIAVCDFVTNQAQITFNQEGAVIKTLEGDMTATRGDYIIKGINGEFYPCKSDIFAKTYDLVSD